MAAVGTAGVMNPAARQQAELLRPGIPGRGKRGNSEPRVRYFCLRQALATPQKKPVKGGGIPVDRPETVWLVEARKEGFFEEVGFAGPPATTGL
jgi:hypothetical protein